MYIYAKCRTVFLMYLFLRWILFLFLTLNAESTQTKEGNYGMNFPFSSRSEECPDGYIETEHTLYKRNDCYYYPYENSHEQPSSVSSLQNMLQRNCSYTYNREIPFCSNMNNSENSTYSCTYINNNEPSYSYSYNREKSTLSNTHFPPRSCDFYYSNNIALPTYSFPNSTHESKREEPFGALLPLLEQENFFNSSEQRDKMETFSFPCNDNYSGKHWEIPGEPHNQKKTETPSVFELEAVVTQLMENENELIMETNSEKPGNKIPYYVNTSVQASTFNYSSSYTYRLGNLCSTKGNNTNSNTQEEESSNSSLYVPVSSNADSTQEIINSYNDTNDVNETNGDDPNDNGDISVLAIPFEIESEEHASDYITVFNITLPCLKDICECVKNINLGNKEERSNHLSNTINSYSNLLKPIECPLILYRKAGKNGLLLKLLNTMEHSNRYLSTSQSNLDTFSILDTITCIKLYTELVIYFSLSNLAKYKHNLKHIYFNKKSTLENMPKNGHELSKNHLDLEKSFSDLLVRTQMKSLLYKLEHFYEKVYDINEENDSLNETILDCSVPNLINRVEEIYRKINHSVRSIVESRRKKFAKSFFQKHQLEISRAIQNSKVLLEEIIDQKNKIKILIKQQLKEPKTIIYYIIHHLSFLFLHRLIASLYIESESLNCTEVFKLFLETCESMFPDMATFPDINQLNKTEQNLILNDEDSITYILRYLFLNIVTFPLKEVEEPYLEFLKTLKKIEESDKMYLDRIDFFECLEKLEKIVHLLKDLYLMLSGINRDKHILQTFIKIFNIRKQINKEANVVLNYLRKEENKSVKINDILHNQFAYTYNHILSLYEDFFTLVKKDIL